MFATLLSFEISSPSCKHLCAFQGVPSVKPALGATCFHAATSVPGYQLATVRLTLGQRAVMTFANGIFNICLIMLKAEVISLQFIDI